MRVFCLVKLPEARKIHLAFLKGSSGGASQHPPPHNQISSYIFTYISIQYTHTKKKTVAAEEATLLHYIQKYKHGYLALYFKLSNSLVVCANILTSPVGPIITYKNKSFKLD